jgi:uncharacterized membrane protein
VRILRLVLRWILVVFFVVAGANHFRTPAIYYGMMPAWVTWPVTANALSGVAEILGGIGLAIPPTQRLAGWGLIALLVVVFPANVHVALQGRMPGTDFSLATLWLRLPFQGLFIYWVWWAAVKRTREEGASHWS